MVGWANPPRSPDTILKKFPCIILFCAFKLFSPAHITSYTTLNEIFRYTNNLWTNPLMKLPRRATTVLSTTSSFSLNHRRDVCFFNHFVYKDSRIQAPNPFNTTSLPYQPQAASEILGRNNGHCVVQRRR